MQRIQKLVIGVRTSSKMFRLPSVGGRIIDAILSQRGSKTLDEEYFSEVSTNFEQGTFRLQSEELGNALRLDNANIVFSKDVYAVDAYIDIDKSIEEFSVLWRIVNEVLKVNNVRRIGMVAEHRFDTTKENPNKILLGALTSIKAPPHPAKLHLRYEDRRTTKEGIAPDIEKSDFINIIYDYYDGDIDADHPAPNTINANLDVQRYYSPLLTSNIPEEAKKLKITLINEKKQFDGFLKDKGVIR